MRDLLLTAFVFGALPFMVMRPSIGLLIWAWLGYMNPHRAAYGFAYSFPFVQVSAIATLLGIAFGKEKARFPWTGTTVIWLLWTMWTGVTTVFAFSVDAAYPGLDRFFKVQVMILVTLLLMHSRVKLNQLVWMIVFSIGAFGVKGGLFTVLTGGGSIVWGPPESFIEGNNELALALLTIVPLMRYVQTQATNKWIKHGLSGAMALCAFSIVGSYSRGALVGGLAIVIVLWMKSRHKLAFGAPLLVVAILAFNFMPSGWSERMNTIGTYEQDASAGGRINAWNFAYRLASDYPITGGGFNVFTPANFVRYAPNPADVHDAHSIYFQVLGEHGFVGLFLFLTLGILTYRNCSWVIRRTRGREDLRWANDLAAMNQVALVGFAVGGAFLGLAYFDLPYHLVAIGVLAKAVTREALAAPPVTAEVPALVANRPTAAPSGAG